MVIRVLGPNGGSGSADQTTMQGDTKRKIGKHMKLCFVQTMPISTIESYARVKNIFLLFQQRFLNLSAPCVRSKACVSSLNSIGLMMMLIPTCLYLK